MIKSCILFAFVLLCFSCGTSIPVVPEPIVPKEIVTVDDYSFEAFAGSNLIRITPNFYADETEVTNSFYKEFIYWMNTVYGVESQEFIDILPDVSVWKFQNHMEFDGNEYLSNANFDDYPIVGISLKQAKLYADWRTDRVAEMRLIDQGYLNPIETPTKENHFTIERFKKGNYYKRKTLKTNFVFCRYTIPTAKEWMLLSGISNDYKYGIDSQNKDNMEFIYNGNSAFHTLENFNTKIDKDWFDTKHEFEPSPTQPAYYGITNIHGLFQTIGNVAEMVDEPGIAKGGDWKHRLPELELLQSSKQNIPNCWTGFRCVSKFEVIKVKDSEKEK